jgi:predicted dehydrogenase
MRYRWAILGTGHIATKMAEALRDCPQAILYGVGSRSLDSAEAFKSKQGFEKAFSSYDELLKDPAVDIVYIATPHSEHYKNTLLCLDHKKHVLCEKPIAVNQHQLVEMQDRAKSQKCLLMEALWTRFLPHFISLSNEIKAGAIGDIQSIRANFCLQVPYDPRHRLYNRELIGGSLLDLGIYPLFLAQHFLGKPIAISSVAQFSPSGVDQDCVFKLDYDQGRSAELHSSLIAQVSEAKAKILGSKGVAEFDEFWFTPGGYQLKNEDNHCKRYQKKEIPNGYVYEAQHVMECLDRGQLHSDLMSPADSLLLCKTLDEIRSQIGLVYPEEI